MSLSKNLLRGVLCAVALSTPVAATCFDAPMWRGEPLTDAYAATLAAEDAPALEQAHIAFLQAHADRMTARRQSIMRMLIPRLLASYDGDRASRGRELRAGDYTSLLEMLDLPSQNDAINERMVDLLWVNGCAVEAVDLMVQRGVFFATTQTAPIALRDADALRTIADHIDQGHAQGDAGLLRSAAMILESPDQAEQVIEARLDAVRAAVVPGQTAFADMYDNPALPLMRAALRGELDGAMFAETAQQFPVDQGGNAIKFVRVVLWSSVIGRCDIAVSVGQDLLTLPADYIQHFEIELEAAMLACRVQTP